MDFQLLRFGAHLISQSGLLRLIETLEATRRNLLRILEYHRIGDPGEENTLLDPTLISASPEQFEQQMNFLQGNYHLISLCDLLHAIDAREPLPPRSVMVTFDDGYHDFLDTAWPILVRYQIPTLLFLATGFPSPENQLFWWDRLYQGICKTNHCSLSLPPASDFLLETKDQRWKAFIELKRRITCMSFHSAMQLVDQIMNTLEVTPITTGMLINWSEARWLNEHGCFLAAHTRNHSILSRISKEEARQEICDSRRDLLRETGIDYPVLAYPSGHIQDCCDELLPIMQEEGLQIAMSSIPGSNDMGRCELLRLKRIGPSPRIDIPEYRLILTRLHNIFGMAQTRFLSH